MAHMISELFDTFHIFSFPSDPYIIDDSVCSAAMSIHRTYDIGHY